MDNWYIHDFPSWCMIPEANRDKYLHYSKQLKFHICIECKYIKQCKKPLIS